MLPHGWQTTLPQRRTMRTHTAGGTGRSGHPASGAIQHRWSRPTVPKVRSSSRVLSCRLSRRTPTPGEHPGWPDAVQHPARDSGGAGSLESRLRRGDIVLVQCPDGIRRARAWLRGTLVINVKTREIIDSADIGYQMGGGASTTHQMRRLPMSRRGRAQRARRFR